MASEKTSLLSLLYTKKYEGRQITGRRCPDCFSWEKPDNGYPSQCRAVDLKLCRDTRLSEICGPDAKLFKRASDREIQRRKELWGDDPS